MNLSCRPCCHASSSRLSSTPPGAEPALFTRMSMRPKCRAAPCTKFSASSRRVRSAGIASTRHPDSRRISSAVVSSTSLRRAQIATSAPSRARTRAMPLPMPRLPPVTSATLPPSWRSMTHLTRVLAFGAIVRVNALPVHAPLTPSVREPLVGAPVRRSEDLRFVTGRGRYVADITLPGQCHAVVVRSEVAHARLAHIDTEAARRAPGVLTVLTYADVADLGSPIPIRIAPLPGFEKYLQMPLANDRARYVGEPLALVVAEDRAAAEDAAERVVVDYAPLAAVVAPRDAVAGRVLVHEATGTNVATHYRVSRGDPGAAFASAAYTRRETFRSQRHTGVPLETRGLVATWDATAGRLTVLGATKVTFFNPPPLPPLLSLHQPTLHLSDA